MAIVTVMRVSNSPAARAALPRREHPVTPTFVESISGAVRIRASRTRWKPHAQAVRTPLLFCQPVFQFHKEKKLIEGRREKEDEPISFPLYNAQNAPVFPLLSGDTVV
jgi:hypothetical protein